MDLVVKLNEGNRANGLDVFPFLMWYKFMFRPYEGLCFSTFDSCDFFNFIISAK